MRKSIYTYAMILALPVLVLMTSCEPRALTAEDVIISEEDQLAEMLDAENPEGYTIYNINTLLDTFMTEQGNFMSDSSRYRTRSYYNGLYLFSIDTFPKGGPGIYIRARVATDDYGGNFYKSMVLQQVNDWSQDGYPEIDQQCLRVSLDMGSAGGMFHQGQEMIIRCNGLAIGRYANQPQLCIPTNNNNIYAGSAEEKTGWAPGRIPAGQFRNAAHMIGMPDVSKLVYDDISMVVLTANYIKKYSNVVAARKADGRLIRISDVHFNGKYDEMNGGPTPCNRYLADSTDLGNPETDKNACTFGPTTGNVGYPQSRFVADKTNKYQVLISTSEYARYAYYYLPAEKYVGSITGVLGYYMDNGNYAPDGGEWSITPCSIENILPECQAEGAEPRWDPVEWKLGVPQPVDE